MLCAEHQCYKENEYKVLPYFFNIAISGLNFFYFLLIFFLCICVTIFLNAEYECHKESKVAGLNCLRNQLTGDELLVWTIETFNMFYKKVSNFEFYKSRKTNTSDVVR